MPTETLHPSYTIDKQLLPEEAKLLAQYEARIQRGLETFFDVGEALNAIKVGKLYRQSHSSFEDYCADKWGIGRAHANRLAEAAEVVGNLKMSPIGDILPANEAQARPLTALKEPEQQVEAWEKAVEAARGQPTAAQVTEAVQAVRQPTAAQAGTPEAAAEVNAALDGITAETPSFASPLTVSISGWNDEPDWVTQLETALRELDGNGLYQVNGRACCMRNPPCRPTYFPATKSYVHEDACPLGAVLTDLALIA